MAKEDGSEKNTNTDILSSIASVTLGKVLVDSLISQQRNLENGRTFEAGVAEGRARTASRGLEAVGLDPDEVAREHLRLLQKALDNKTK